MKTKDARDSKPVNNYSGAIRNAMSGRYVVARNKAVAYFASDSLAQTVTKSHKNVAKPVAQE